METLATARDAFERHDFETAVVAFAEAEASAPLSPSDLESLAHASWWTGDADASVASFERAFAGYQKAGDAAKAAGVALRLCAFALRRMAFAIGSGWFATAERLLANEPEGWTHAWLSLTRMMFAFFKDRDMEAGLELAEATLEVARRHENLDVESLVLSIKAQVLVRQGSWTDGLALVDEATAAAISGMLEPHTACDVYCLTISTCRSLFDYQRAGEWTEEADRFMQRNSLRGYRGTCKAHRAELLRLRGYYDEAEQEALAACAELEAFRLFDGLGYAYNEVGEARLRRGDLDGAEEAFLKGHEYGRIPQPGWSLLLLARGRADEAASAIDRALEGAAADDDRPSASDDLLRRARLLPTQVETALATGRLETARAAVAELEDLAKLFETPAVQAAAVTARGSLELSEGAPSAEVTLERARRLWLSLDMPFESARTRLALGAAHAAAGDTAAAEMEMRSAVATLERLGAAHEARRAKELLRSHGTGRRDDRDETIKTFMFTDIVASTDLVRLIGDRAWERLLAWHDRELRSKVGEHGGEVVRHTGDGLFVAFEDPERALDCAISIQRRLAEAREAQGFAPSVRIGLHTAEATRLETDFAGHGVHVAARVADLAGAEEIVVSRDTLERAGPDRYAAGAARTERVKGVEEPIEVVTIEWR